MDTAITSLEIQGTLLTDVIKIVENVEIKLTRYNKMFQKHNL